MPVLATVAWDMPAAFICCMAWSTTAFLKFLTTGMRRGRCSIQRRRVVRHLMLRVNMPTIDVDNDYKDIGKDSLL